jgi:hypothetical protein
MGEASKRNVGKSLAAFHQKPGASAQVFREKPGEGCSSWNLSERSNTAVLG